MDRTKDVPEVTQIDREAAFSVMKKVYGERIAWIAKKGEQDRHHVVQAFARHRTEATRPLTAEIADLRAQLDEAMEALAGLFYLSAESGEIDRNLAFKDARAILAKRRQP